MANIWHLKIYKNKNIDKQLQKVIHTNTQICVHACANNFNVRIFSWTNFNKHITIKISLV